MRWTARLWGTLATLALAFMALRSGIPQSSEFASWEQPTQLAILLVMALGSALAWRWEGIGASLVTVSAAALGIFAAIEYRPAVAVVLFALLYIPGLLFWLLWQQRHSGRAIVALAFVMLLIVSSGGFGAAQVYSYYYGPTHPESPLQALPDSPVEWIWAGALTERSFRVTVKLAQESDQVRLAISRQEDLSDADFWEPADDPVNAARVVSFSPDGLAPGTDYFYAVEVNGRLDLVRRGQVRTPATTAFSFSFAFGSCARTDSNGAVFDTIRETEPLFFLALGDFHYENIVVNDPDLFREAFDRQLSAPAQAALYRQVPIAYVWDDHDFGGNDSDAGSPSKAAASLVYRQYVPHYPLASSRPDGPIYQAFTIGRARFIVTDTRSARSPSEAPDDDRKTMLGDEQKSWLKQELLSASGHYPLIFWINPDPWIGQAAAGSDGWAGYATERQELADFIAENQIDGLVMLSGDAHMLAIDDGSNSDYASRGGTGFPVMHAAALDRRGAVRGGPYSEGSYPGGGQFGLVTIDDNGGTAITVKLSGRDWTGAEKVQHQFTVSAPTGSAPGR